MTDVDFVRTMANDARVDSSIKRQRRDDVNADAFLFESRALERAADALALVEAARGVKPMPAVLDALRARDPEIIARAKAVGIDPNRELAHRLVATALALLEAA